jgi:peptidase S41-like protein
MRRLGRLTLLALNLAVFAFATPLRAETQSQVPDFKEVYDLVRAHLAGVSEADLNSKAVRALISTLGPKVSLVQDEGDTVAPEGTALIGKSSLFEGQIGYFRINRIAEGLPSALRESYEKVSDTNKLKGVVLDLRYTGGNDYSAAAAVADLFLKKERPLMDWGTGMVRSKEKADAITLPVAALVNRNTAGAAEALAAILRETGAALLLGRQTSGQAAIAQEYPLKSGGRLRIATAPIVVGDSSALPMEGIRPDIVVEVSPQDERAYYADAFKELPPSASASVPPNQGNGTNRNRRARFNEAELVRERRDGYNPDLEVPSSSNEQMGEKPVVRDPALVRALDVLKGLSVVRHSRS